MNKENMFFSSNPSFSKHKICQTKTVAQKYVSQKTSFSSWWFHVVSTYLEKYACQNVFFLPQIGVNI